MEKTIKISFSILLLLNSYYFIRFTVNIIDGNRSDFHYFMTALALMTAIVSIIVLSKQKWN